MLACLSTPPGDALTDAIAHPHATPIGLWPRLDILPQALHELRLTSVDQHLGIRVRKCVESAPKVLAHRFRTVRQSGSPRPSPSRSFKGSAHLEFERPAPLRWLGEPWSPCAPLSM